MEQLRISSFIILWTVLITSLDTAHAFYPTNFWLHTPSHIDPNDPLTVQGSVDLIQPAHKSWYLAYRLLNDMKLPPAGEQSNRIHTTYYAQEWLRRIQSIKGSQIKEVDYQYCLQSNYATILFDQRVRFLGISHPYVMDWVRAQETVFSNCMRKEDEPVLLPSPFWLAPAADQQLRKMAKADHDYQTASAYFYARRYDEAITYYRKIADQKDHPYWEIGHFMVARCYLNKRDMENIQKSYLLIMRILGDDSLVKVHDMSQQLLGTIAYRMLGTIAYRSLNSKIKKDHFSHVIAPLHQDPLPPQTTQHSQFQANYDMWYYLYYGRNDTLFNHAIRSLASKNDFLDWILTFLPSFKHAQRQNGDMLRAHWAQRYLEPPCKTKCAHFLEDYKEHRRTLSHVIDKWQQSQKLHWLIAAMLRLDPEDEFTGQALEIVLKIDARVRSQNATDAELYAYPTLAHHAMRLLINRAEDDKVEDMLVWALSRQKDYAPRAAEKAIQYWLSMGKDEHAGRVLDKVLSLRSMINPVPFLKLKLITSQNLDEFIDIATNWQGYEDSYRHYMDGLYPYEYYDLINNLQNLLNLYPIKDLISLTKKHDLPDFLRRQIALVAWNRAVLLQKYEVADQLAEFIQQNEPQLAAYFTDYMAAETALAKRRIAAFIMLRNPAIRPLLPISLSFRRHPGKELEYMTPFETIATGGFSDSNWWCQINPESMKQATLASLYDSIYFPDTLTEFHPTPAPSWLQRLYAQKQKRLSEFAPLKQINHTELDQLHATGPGTILLQDTAINWAKSRNIFQRYLFHDRRIPAALNRAAIVPRYGCRMAEDTPQIGENSKTAFRLLHKKYWFSHWREATPYWFK